MFIARPSIFIFLLTILSLSLSAQKILLSYHFSKDSVSTNIHSIFSKHSFKDSLLVNVYLSERILMLYEKGYLESSIDSLIFNKTEADVYIHIGEKYEEINIKFDKKYEDILLEVNSKYLNPKFNDARQIENENMKIISFLENNGYPFASIKLDSILFEHSKISAYLNIERGDKLLYDTVKISGNLKVSNSFLYGYTGIKPKQLYNAKKIEGLRSRINDLPFAQQDTEANLRYRDGEIKLYIPARQLKNNRFDGILGILPNDETTGKLVLTGEVNIFLQNILRSAEELNFKWQKLESSSQKLLVDFKIPYIFNTKLGLSSGLNLHKQDTTFLTSILKLGTQFYFSGQNNIGIQYQSKKSSILTTDTILQTRYKDYQISSTGLTFNYKKLDYYFNPHRGIELRMNSSVGKKNIKSEVPTNSSLVQYDAILDLKWYIKLRPKQTLLISNQTATIISEFLYKNELYQIGGLKSIRGFLESSIYASSYSVISFEYRFIFEKNSSMFAFFDGAWYEKKLETYYYDYPFGFGFGLFFKTKAGVFTISYAMGQQRNEHMNIKNAKIHFGFINKF